MSDSHLLNVRALAKAKVDAFNRHGHSSTDPETLWYNELTVSERSRYLDAAYAEVKAERASTRGRRTVGATEIERLRARVALLENAVAKLQRAAK